MNDVFAACQSADMTPLQAEFIRSVPIESSFAGRLRHLPATGGNPVLGRHDRQDDLLDRLHRGRSGHVIVQREQMPVEFETEGLVLASERLPLLEQNRQVSGRHSALLARGNTGIVARPRERDLAGRAHHEQRVLATVERHRLQQRKQSPAVVEVTVREQYGAHFGDACAALEDG